MSKKASIQDESLAALLTAMYGATDVAATGQPLSDNEIAALEHDPEAFLNGLEKELGDLENPTD